MESGFRQGDNGHQLVPLFPLENVTAPSLGIWPMNHLEFCLGLSWGLVLFYVGENGGDLRYNEGKSPFDFTTFLLFALLHLNMVILLTQIVFDLGCR